MRIVMISDTHGKHRELESIPDGDVFIHSGDITYFGEHSAKVLSDFDDFLKSLPHKYKIVIAGNHDTLFEEKPSLAKSFLKDCIYLQDRSIVIDGIKFYGSPFQPVFHDWAFNLPRYELIRKWEQIPIDTDVLITHCPPYTCNDKASGQNAGCPDLLEAVKRIKPKLHIFGHIHEAQGIIVDNGTTFVNASICDKGYKVANPPIVCEIDKNKNVEVVDV